MQSIHESCIHLVCVCVWDYVRGFVCTRAYFMKLYCALFMNNILHCSRLYSRVSFFGDSRFLKINLKFAWTKKKKQKKECTRLASGVFACTMYISKECKQNMAIEKRVNFSVKHILFSILLHAFAFLLSFHLILCIRSTCKNETKIYNEH